MTSPFDLIREPGNGPDEPLVVTVATAPSLREQLKGGRVLWPDQALKLIALGDKLAASAERLEENPLANCLPTFRYPVVDAVAEWKKAVDDI